MRKEVQIPLSVIATVATAVAGHTIRTQEQPKWNATSGKIKQVEAVLDKFQNANHAGTPVPKEIEVGGRKLFTEVNLPVMDEVKHDITEAKKESEKLHNPHLKNNVVTKSDEIINEINNGIAISDTYGRYTDAGPSELREKIIDAAKPVGKERSRLIKTKIKNGIVL
jgi:hypothetical protein